MTIRRFVAILALCAGAFAPSVTWAAGRTISINFGSGKGSVSGEYGIVPSSSWNNFSAAKQTTAVDVMVSDGTTGVTAMWWSSTIWGWTTATDNALKGYLDDGACGDGTTGTGPHIAILGIPFSYYDVIVYYATDSGSNQFNPAAFKEWTQQSKCGDESDSYDGTMRLSRGNASLKFGKSQNLTAEVGTNVAYIKRCFSFENLDIKGAPGQNSARGGIAAIQIVECDPHESEMYHNRLAGTSATVSAATYGEITVGTPIKATKYTSQTTLSLTGSTTEISGNLQYVEGIGTDTRTHTIAGWFRCDGLDGEKMLYGARSHLTSAWGGYKVTVDANGAINVGQCGNWAWQGTALKSANGVIKANTWYHIAVAVTSAKPDARTATVKVFVNGSAIDFPTSTMATNLDGSSKCIEFSIGGGVSAAGLYADFSAISDAGLVQSLATNAKYVSYQGNTYTTTIDQQSVDFSSLVWDPSHSGSFSGTESLIVNVKDVDQTQLTFDIDPNAAEMALVSSVDVTLAKGSETTVTLPSYDFTGVSGKLTLGIPISGVTASYPANPNVFFDYEYTGAPPLEKGTLEYSNAALTWANNIAGTWTLKVAAGDNLSIDSTSNIRPTFNVDISGGTLTFDPDGSLATAWCGSNGSTTYTQTGGEVYFKANGQSQSGSGNGVILGYTGTSATPLVLDISGGLFAVENSSINFWNAATINLTGGKVRAKGVFAGATSGTHTVNIGAGAVFELGSLGWRSGSADVTLSGTLRAFENAAMANDFTYTDGAKLVAASGTYLFISGEVSGEGTLTCGDETDNGEVVFMGDAPAGVAGTYYYGYEVTINDCGKMAIPEGKEVDKIRVFDASGKALTITGHDEKYIYFEWEITGGACWWDYEFEGNGNNSGTEGTALSWDGGRPYSGNEYVTDETTGEQSLHIPSRPWRDVSSWPTEATFVMYGTMVCSNKTYQLAFGSSTASTKNQLILATRSVADGTVDLCYSSAGGEPTVLCTMTVPNAQSANHLYAFVLKTDDNGNSVVNTYLDGELLQPYTHEGTLTLGAGFQIASGHGGVASGYSRPADNDPALLDWLRVYNLELSTEAMEEYAKRYPYVPPNGSYQRDVVGYGQWNASKAWTKEGTTTVTNVPAEGAVVKIDVDGNGGLDVNLSSDATYDTIQITGDGTFTLDRATAYSGKVRSAGRVTAKTDVVFAYDAFAMAGAPLTVADNCTVTFDMSSVELDVWSPAVYDLTGLVTTGENAKVECSYGTVPTGRSVWYGIDPADQHFKFHIGVDGILVADLTKDTTFNDLEWKVNGTKVSPDWAKTVYGTISNLAEGATLTFDDTLKSSDSILSFAGEKAVLLATNNEATVSGVTYDFTGLDAKATFKFNPDPAKVLAGYVRYDLDMGTYLYNEILISAGGRYEFKKVRIDGNNYDYHDRTVIVQEGDYLLLHDGTNLGSGLSLDVRGGEVHIGNLEGRAAIAYGQNGTRFNQSGGTVTVHANGTTPSGTSSGFVLAHSANGGGCHEFNVTGGTFTVPDSYICFNEATNTINVSGTGLVRAKGAFSAKTTTTGVINVSSGGTLEVGSLGMTDGACTLNLNGGTLRGYEDGAAIANSITLQSDSKLTSAQDVSLTVSGGATGEGKQLTIAEGTVKLGNDAGLGTAAVVVADGATFDLNGYKSENALTISGVGVGGAGVLVNNAAGEGSYKGALNLSGAATIGGSGVVSLSQGSDIDLSGHTLTLLGKVKFGGFTVASNGGSVVVGSGGTLLSNGATALGGAKDTCDLTIAANGTLDLSGGSTISCWNFKCAGAVVGEQAKLIVNGTLNATSSVSITNLKLGDGATLSGLKLVVTYQIEFGTTLYVVGTDKSRSITIATVPDKDVTMPTTVYIDGDTSYTLSRVGTKLIAINGSVILADVLLNELSPWVNLESLLVSGSVSGFQGASSGATNIHFVVTAGDGSVTTQSFAYVSTDGAFLYELSGFKPGGEYQIFAYLTIEHAEVDAKSKVSTVFEANNVGAWIDESASTFDILEIKGTGQWNVDHGTVATKTQFGKSVLSFDGAKVLFSPTNTSMVAYNSQIRDITVKASYTVGFEIVAGDACNAGVRMGTNSLGVCQLEVKVGDVWQVVNGLAAESNTLYEIRMRLDSLVGKVSYTLIGTEENVELGSGEMTAIVKASNFNVTFAGTGMMETLVGVCRDVNLCSYGNTEYANLDQAVEAVGDDKSIVPIWLSAYKLKDESGAFKVASNDLLTVSWDKWYHVVQSGDYNGVTYNWIVGNNWIEYSDENGVEKSAEGEYVVKSAEGLAWIAAEATNGWFAGNVTLGADIDLSSKNWTPIAKFTGAFDGAGHIITGLNNTNVVESVILGAAGYYHGGVTNDWGYSSYGLFGCTTNATIQNMALRDIAISATDESTAALVGVHALGDLTICNVTNESGYVKGAGVVAGIVTLGGNGGDIDQVTVNGNVNRAELIGVENANVAQILAGTIEDTKFMGEVDATGNVGTGSAEVDAPICNFADVISYYDDDDNYWRYVEANDPSSVPIDPVYNTARMLRGYYANGSTDPLGGWVDMITAAKAGSVIQITKSDVDIDGWSTVLIDRDVTIDLNANAIYCVYDCNVFEIASDVTLTITNGIISAAKDFKAFSGEGTVVNQGDSVKIIQLTKDFEERTISPVNSLQLTGSSVKIVIPFASSACYYSVLRKDSLSDDKWTEGNLVQGEDKELELEVDATSSSGFFQVQVITSGIED